MILIDTEKHLNVFDFIGFPDYSQRVKIKEKFFDLNRLRLIQCPLDLIIIDIKYEFYYIWSAHLNNFLSSLNIQFFNMCNVYLKHPPEYKLTESNSEEQRIYKLFFDTYAEVTIVYLMSYYEKSLSMYNDVFCLNEAGSHRKIVLEKLDELKNPRAIPIIIILKEIANSKEFKYLNSIRNDFIHNKSRFQAGMNIVRKNGGFISGNGAGESTEKIMDNIIKLLSLYETYVNLANKFFQGEFYMNDGEFPIHKIICF